MQKSKYRLSILIPARNEEFLNVTVRDLLKNKTEDTEIIVGFDGNFANPPIPDHPDIKIFYCPESMGQRQITKQLCRLSNSHYIAKTDAHCIFDKHFDKKMFEAFERAGDNSVILPIMRNLWMFDWKCLDCGDKQYQGPKPEKCKKCGGTNIKKKMVIIAKKSPQSVSYCFDSQPHFQYFRDYAKRPEYKKDLEETGLTKTMSIQGSFFMMTREKYFSLNMDDEIFGSWGSQGLVIACKTWLSGGQVLVNHNTWYSHTFRTQKDFGFPYPQSGRQVENAKKTAKDLFFNNKWHLQVRPLSWVLDRFKPINGWTDKEIEEQKEREKNHPKFGVNVKKALPEVKKTPPPASTTPTKSIIYYTDNCLKLSIAKAVQNQLRKVSKETGLPIVSASLKPMPHFGDKNIHLPLKRGILTMFKQTLAALENSTADVIFHCEADCLYPKEHFDFIPPRKDVFYYNLNVIKVNMSNGNTLKVDVCRQVSGLCAYRELLVEEYKKRIEFAEKIGFSGSNGYEPGTKSIRRGGFSDYTAEDWKSTVPILDLRHDNNLTRNRWSKDQFRNQKNTIGWTEGTIDDVPEWTDLRNVLKIS